MKLTLKSNIKMPINHDLALIVNEEGLGVVHVVGRPLAKQIVNSFNYHQALIDAIELLTETHKVCYCNDEGTCRYCEGRKLLKEIKESSDV